MPSGWPWKHQHPKAQHIKLLCGWQVLFTNLWIYNYYILFMITGISNPNGHLSVAISWCQSSGRYKESKSCETLKNLLASGYLKNKLNLLHSLKKMWPSLLLIVDNMTECHLPEWTMPVYQDGSLSSVAWICSWYTSSAHVRTYQSTPG